MRVLTYNIAGHRGVGRPGHLEEVAALILESGADVVGLQEVIHHERDEQPPEELLAALTGMHAVYLPAHQGRGKLIGNAVLCCRPLIQTVSHELPHQFPERRILLEVETTTAEGLPLTVFCTHLVHMARAGARIRLVQATAVAKRMSACFRPHLLMGDLNASPHAGELHPVRKVAVRADHLTGLRSWPSRRPLLLYDHIWPGPGWEIEAVEILAHHVSDHRPVLAQLGWRGAARYNIMPDAPYLTSSSPLAHRV